MKKLLSVFGILALCLTFAGWNKEKDKDNGSLLVGIWELVASDIVREGVNLADIKVYYVLNENGSYVAHMVFRGSYSKTEGTYRANGNKLTKAGGEEEEEAEIVKLTSSELVLKMEDDGGTRTFNKITSLPDFEDAVKVK
jgi:uncharacterized protein (TIGR03066 family)